MKQIVIITENKPGIIADIASALTDHEINIESFDVETDEDHGVFSLNVNKDYDLALRVLLEKGYNAVTEDAIVIRLEDKPGALARVAQRFAQANINVRSVRIIRRLSDYSLVAISTERTDEAMQLVEDLRVF